MKQRRPAITRPARRTRRGSILIDTVVGLVVVLMMLTTLIMTRSHAHRLENQMADRRSMVRALEMHAMSPATEQGDVEADVLDSPAPQGYAWVRLEFERDGMREVLVTLRPAEEAQ
ncbi:MAG: hypothetical protein AAF078_02885 [Planctomycetota bacterium]